MATISKKQFRELAAVQGVFCVSIYLPVHRSGMETLNKKDALVFKNQLKLVSEELIRRGMASSEAAAFLQPAWDLQRDTGFWRYQEDGLAVFLAEGFLQYFKLPFTPSPYLYVSHEFYLRPLMRIFTGDGRFYLLGLNLHHVTFFEGDRQGLREIYVKDIAPQRLEEVVGADFKERFQQFRTQREGHGKGVVFHGHGEWKGEFRKEEILQFFRAVDKSIIQRIEDRQAPMLVAGVNYLFPIYEEANTYQHLLEAHVSHNPDNLSREELHREAWLKVYDYFDRERQEKVELYGHYQETPRTSFEVEEIIPAAFAGRIDTLFMDEASEVWGIYDPATGEVDLHDEQKTINTELLNLAAKEVLLNRGKVYLQGRETLPQSFAPMNALYRY